MANTSDRTYYKKISLWKDVSPEDWYDRKWQLKNLVRDLDTLSKVVKLTDDERHDISEAIKHSKFQATPYYLSLIDNQNFECPIKLQAIPRIAELDMSSSDIHDPLAEDADSPVPRLVHRYPDRVLFLVSEVCSMYCRFCTRKRHILDKTASQLALEHDKAIEYIEAHNEVRDVILSGGDALMLPVDVLEGIVKRIRAIPHVEIIRVASRMPCVLPMGVTDEYVNMLSKYQPIFFMTHFNHPYEVTSQAAEACDRISRAGMPVYNQSVLLRNINSDPRIIKRLMHDLLKMRVHPYYIYQCDLAEGIEHFRTPVSMGFNILEHLRGHTSGLAVPTFVIDAPGGGGKIPIMPNYMLTMTAESVVVRNYRGMMSSYANPKDADCACSTAEAMGNIVEKKKKNSAYIDLVEGHRITLEPKI